jgi:hypothetical protein
VDSLDFAMMQLLGKLQRRGIPFAARTEISARKYLTMDLLLAPKATWGRWTNELVRQPWATNPTPPSTRTHRHIGYHSQIPPAFPSLRQRSALLGGAPYVCSRYDP